MAKYLSRRRFGTLAAGAALAGALPRAAAAQAGRTVVIGVVNGTPRHLNSAVQSGVATGMPAAQLFASPLRYDENWNPQPYLAKSWQMAEDGRSLTLRLVEHAVFHDGKPITSADVAFSLTTVKKNHPFQQMFEPVETVETPDPLTAVIKLSRPHPALLLSMSPVLLPIIPKHVFDDGTDIKVHPANAAPVGSGPFKLVEFKPGEHIILQKHEKFFIPDRPKLDRLIMRIVDDSNAVLVSMERQEINLLPLAASPRDIDRLAKQPHLAVTGKGSEGMGPLNWLAFNLKKEPLNDKRVRQAISFAIDRDFITRRLMLGRAQIATGPIVPGTPFYTDAVERYAVDLDKANRLLDEAGKAKGADGNRFSLSVDYIPNPAGAEQQKAIAEYLKPQLKKIGIDVQVRAAPDFPTWAKRVGSWDFDMSMDSVFNWGDPVIGVHRTYVSSNIRQGVIWSNTQNYSNARVDEVLAQAAIENDLSKRKALYAEFQKTVVDDAPIAFINVVPFSTIYQKGLAGLPTTIWGALSPMDELYWETPPK